MIYATNKRERKKHSWNQEMIVTTSGKSRIKYDPDVFTRVGPLFQGCKPQPSVYYVIVYLLKGNPYLLTC